MILAGLGTCLWLPAVASGATQLRVACQVTDDQLTDVAQASPSEQSFAVVTRTGQVRIVDFAGKTVGVLRAPHEVITCLAYSPDGTRLMTGTETGKVLVWDVKAGTSRTVFKRPGTRAARVDWLGDTGRGVLGVAVDFEKRKETPSGSVFSLSDGATVSTFHSFIRDDFQTLFALRNGKGVAVLEVPDQPRGAFLLHADTGTVEALLYDREHGSGPLSVAVAPDSKTVAVGYAPWDVILWDSTKGERISVLEGHTNWVVALAFSPDGRRLVSGAGDCTARIWDVATGRELGQIEFRGRNPSLYVKSVGFSSDGKLVFAAAEDGRIVIAEAPGVR
jgi:WD40 repeat protein